MDLQIQTTTQGVKDHQWLASAKNLHKYGKTMTTADLVYATHAPDGWVKPGTVLAQFTTGATNVGLWTPWVEDGGAAGFEGEDTIAGIVFEGFQVRRDAAGAFVSTRTYGSVLLPEDNNRIIVSKLPAGLMTNGSTANTATAAQLIAAGFSVLEV